MIGNVGKVLTDVSLKDYTTYKLSGTIKKVVYPENLEQLRTLLAYLKENKIKYMVLGNGSNLIFVGDYDGVIIKLDALNNLIIDGTIVKVEAGYNLMKLAIKTVNKGLSGLEFASGIPATVGGAIYMNAGAYKSQMSDVVKEVTVINDKLELQVLSNEELQFAYRTSVLQTTKWICINATIELELGNKDELLTIIKDRKSRRVEAQPLEYPSAGSVFRNPDGDFAGRLIENLGLKGLKIGGAFVSDKHANFIVSDGTATGEDIKKLIGEVKKQVKDKYGIELIVEQEFIE